MTFNVIIIFNKKSNVKFKQIKNKIYIGLMYQ